MTNNCDDHRYMSRALQLARKGLFTADPNPRVGCVIVKDGLVVGEGWHKYAGGPHAEIHALREASDRALGATAYVTLEPCCHSGKTPPCTDELIAAKISRVVVAMEDPNPLVGGQGLQQLEQAGITTQTGIQQTAAEDLNAGFIKRMRKGRPFVRSKLAISLDGRTAMASGESKWITGEPARLDVQRLRARSSAILMGIGTVLSDDPSMNVRMSASQLGIDGDVRQPLRVVLDPHLSMLASSKMLGVPGKTLVLTDKKNQALGAELENSGAEVLSVSSQRDMLDLMAVLDLLAQREVNEVLLETGAVLSGAMLQAGLIDELVIYLAPHLMGDSARGLFNLPGLDEMQDRIDLRISDVRAVGDDWRITARVDN